MKMSFEALKEKTIGELLEIEGGYGAIQGLSKSYNRRPRIESAQDIVDGF